jgi:hypothetical protein
MILTFPSDGKGLKIMTKDELDSLKEKDITQWLIKRGEQRMLEDNGDKPHLVALGLNDFLKVDIAAVAKAQRHWHTQSITKKH